MRRGGGPSELELDTGSGTPERLVLVGTTFAGAIYRSGHRLYRVMPIARIPRPENRHEVVSARESARKERRPGFTPIDDAGQDRGLYWIRYRGAGARTMADVLGAPDPRARLEYAARMVRGLDGWSKALAQPPLLMPAEVVFPDGGDAELLTMPYRPPLEVEEAVTEPERVCHLAPEVVRGRNGGGDAASYALGVTLLRCFYELPPGEPDQLLQRVANGTTFEARRLRSSMPSWLARLEATREAIETARRLMARDPAGRPGLDAAGLADRLAQLSAQMEPVAAVTGLRRSGDRDAAFSLLQDVLLEGESYELLMLGGEIAYELDRPLEAIDLFERAAALRERPEPYERQLEIMLPILSGGKLADVFLALTGAETDVSLSVEGARSTGASLERRMLRDFGKLTPERRERFVEPVARSLMARESYRAAADFVRPALFDGERYLWWKFGMTILYAEALFRLGGEANEAAARELVQEIKGNLRRVRENRSMTPEEITVHGRAITELEVEMAERRATSAPAAAGGSTR